MEENKGFLKKLQEFFKRIFGRSEYKQLSEASINKKETEKIEDISKESNEIETNEKENANNFKASIAVDLETNINQEETEEFSIEKFSFPVSFKGYTFKTESVKNIENDYKNSYVCLLSEFGNNNMESVLPICRTGNKEKAEIIQKSLERINFRDKDSIKYILKNGFPLDDTNNERFYLPEDYHLNSLLQGIANAKEYDEIISIPVDYLLKLTPKGYRIIKSDRLIEEEEKKRIEEEQNNINYGEILRRYIIENDTTQIENFSDEQLKILKKYYLKILNNIQNKNEYLELAIACLSNLSNYSNCLKDYELTKKEIEINSRNSVMKNILNEKLKDTENAILNVFFVHELNKKMSIFNRLESDIEK